jgi:hypothetical protein
VPEATRLLDRIEPVLASSDRYEWAAAQVLRAELIKAHDSTAALEAADEAIGILESLGTQPLLERARSIMDATETT